VDRDWPDYNYPKPLSDDPTVANYIRFVTWHVANSGTVAERFQVGSNQQFKLLKQPERYPGFVIRNIAANGQVWTGRHDNTRAHFPPLDQLAEEEYPGENACSAAIRISYGKFDYFNGGDLVHDYSPGTWRDIETPIGMATGNVDVCEVNHHAKDAMGGRIHPGHATPRIRDTGICLESPGRHRAPQYAVAIYLYGRQGYLHHPPF